MPTKLMPNCRRFIHFYRHKKSFQTIAHFVCFFLYAEGTFKGKNVHPQIYPQMFIITRYGIMLCLPRFWFECSNMQG